MKMIFRHRASFPSSLPKRGLGLPLWCLGLLFPAVMLAAVSDAPAEDKPANLFVPTVQTTAPLAPRPPQAPTPDGAERMRQLLQSIQSQQGPRPQAPQVQPPVPPAQPPVPQAQTPPPQPQVPFVPPPKPAVPAPVQKRGDVSFNFDDADVFSVIQTIFGDVLKVNYIVAPEVKGRVTFRSIAPVAKEDVMPLMEVILRLNGVGVVEEGGLFRIIPIADLPKEPAPVGVGRDSEKVKITGKALVQVVPVKYVQSSDMIRVLTPFLSKNAVMIDVPKSNYIIISDTDANVKRLLHLVGIFDSEALKQVTPQVFVYPVQNSKAKDVAALLQQIFLGKSAAPSAAKPATPTTPPKTPVPGQPTQVQPPQSSTSAAHGEALVAETTRIIPDEVTNSIVILATPEDYGLIYETIAKIDISPRQVVIEGLIARVDLTDNISFGMKWGVKTDVKLHPFKRDWNLDGSVSIAPGAFLDQSGKLSVPGKGFSFVGSDPTGNIRAAISALAEESKAKVLAAPHILVSDNREARIQVGRQVPIATSTTSQLSAVTTTGTSTTATPTYGTSTIQYKDIGIILKVKPQVNDSGLVSLELTQEISSLGETVKVGGLDELSINKTEATTTLVAQDGDTIIIGGLIQEDVSLAKDGIPLLSKIPLIGNLFGSTTDNKIRTELIILLTPHVMKNQREAQSVTSEYLDRYKGTTKDRRVDEFIKERGQKNGDSRTSKEQELPKE